MCVKLYFLSFNKLTYHTRIGGCKTKVLRPVLIKFDDTQKINRLSAPSFNGLVVAWKA